MSIASEIKRIVQEKFEPTHFELINESDLHKGHAGHDGSGDSHFKLIIVSKAFFEHNRVQRSRQVYSLLNPLFDKGLHALSLKLYTPEEYSS